MRGAPGAPLVSRRVSPEFRARACVFSPAPRSLIWRVKQLYFSIYILPVHSYNSKS